MAATPEIDRPDHVAHYWEHGYAVVRGLFPKDEMRAIQAETHRIYAEGLKHHATWRHQNLLYELLPESFAGQRYMLQAHWVAWISPLFERIRRDPRVLAVMQPLLGADIRQVAQQIHWKPPGANWRSGYRFHQDLRFRDRTDGYQEAGRQPGTGARRPRSVGPADGARLQCQHITTRPCVRHPELCARVHQPARGMGVSRRRVDPAGS